MHAPPSKVATPASECSLALMSRQLGTFLAHQYAMFPGLVALHGGSDCHSEDHFCTTICSRTVHMYMYVRVSVSIFTPLELAVACRNKLDSMLPVLPWQ